jgi:hypothetical protein
VLDLEPSDGWAVATREELARWLDADPEELKAEAGAWVDGQLDRPAAGADLAHTWLAALLELPGEAVDRLILATLQALALRDEAAIARFRSEVSRAMARFHVPQWQRLVDRFNRAAALIGQEPSWG